MLQYGMKTLEKILVTIFLITVSGSKVYAQNPPKIDELGNILDSVFSQILPIGGLLAVGMLVYGGYMWLISGGDPGKVKQAQGTLTWAIFGLIFLVIFGIVLREIFDFLGT